MSDPSNPNDWQQVPGTPPNSASQGYPPPAQGYPPPQAAYPPPDAGYPPPPTGYPPQQPPPGYGAPPQASGLSDTAAAALAYVTIIPAIIFLVMEPYKRVPLIKFHSLQCIFFCVAAIVFDILLSIVWGIVAHIVPFLALFGLIIWPLVSLAFFIIWVLCIFKASKGEWFKLPIIGDIAMKQAQSVNL
jgi:uncharacterized membrane protein